MLADLGARVIKVEVLDGDPYRHLSPAAPRWPRRRPASRRSASTSRPTPAARIARQLCAGADIVVHNARPGVPERLGLGEEQLRADNPGLIWVSLTGYNRHSPAARRPSTHPCAGAAAGGAGYQAGPALTATCETLDEVREISRQLMRANEANPDPNSGVVLGGADRPGPARPRALRDRPGGVREHARRQHVRQRRRRPRLRRQAAAPDRRRRAARHGRRLPPLPRRRRLAVPRRRRATPSGSGRSPCSSAPTSPTTPASRRPTVAPPTTASWSPSSPTRFGKRTAAEWEERFVAAGVAGVHADLASPGLFFAHDQQVLANDFTPLVHPHPLRPAPPLGTDRARQRRSGRARAGRPRRRADRRAAGRAGPRRRRHRRAPGDSDRQLRSPSPGSEHRRARARQTGPA